MDKRIILGVDAPLSPATLCAIQALGDFCTQLHAPPHVILLHVIPIPYIASPSLGVYTGHFQAATITVEQRIQAETQLFKVRSMLLDLASTRLENCIRTGTPADEIARLAREMQADLIVIGSRGNGTRQKLRRLLAGSTSRNVLEQAPCPVMIVAAPRVHRPSDLVSWYEESITRYLNEHSRGLTVFTPRQVAQNFVPPNKKAPGRKETAAAILALEQLARNGILCRHDVGGEMRYVND